MTGCVSNCLALALAWSISAAPLDQTPTTPQKPPASSPKQETEPGQGPGWTSAGISPVSSNDGVWVLRGASGWVYTARWHLDFELDLEFRVLEPGSSGGILVRARGGDGDNRAGHRINLTDKLDGSKALGRIVSRHVHSPKLDLKERQFDQHRLSLAAKPTGEWQTMRIVADVREIRVTLNGTLIAVADGLPQAGHLGLESESGRVEIRQMRITRREPYLHPLPPSGGDLVYSGKGEHKITGVILPKILKANKTNYPPESLRRGVVGVVFLEIIVLADGTVGPIHIVKSLDPELDQEAVGTVRQWLFKPAQKDGRAIAAWLEVEMSFSLK